MSIKKDVRALHLILSYMWEDVHFEGQDVVELNAEEIGNMMDLINRISDQVEDLTNV